MRRSRFMWLPVLALLSACSAGSSRPRDWGALRLAAEDACPQLIGRYLLDASPVPWSLALRFVPLEAADREPESFAVADQTDSTLLVTVRFTDGTDAARTLRRGGAYDGDYFCDDGWVQLGDGRVSDRWDDQLPRRGEKPKRRALRLAPAVDGALVARLDGVWFDGFQPYAPGSGDGIPLPWTWRRAHAWSRTEPFTEVARARQQRLGTPKAPAPAQARRVEQALPTDDPVYLAEQALENPPPPPSQAIARRRIEQTAPPGLRVVAVTPRETGWHVSVEARDTLVVAAFVSRLVEQSDVLEARHESLYRGITPDGQWATVVFVHLAERR